MVNSKCLLYIDILGFSDLVKNDFPKVKKLFKTINELKVHRHRSFKTIVFSDTILIFNKINPISSRYYEYLIMYACEFTKELLLHSTELEIQFRAILTYDEFYYEELENIEAYHGNALINTYNKEKEINGIGLFIDKKILQLNTKFPTTSFDKDLNFVYLTQALERLNEYCNISFPIPTSLVNESLTYIDQEVKLLKKLKMNIDNQVDSKIRSKYLQTYYLYKQRYGDFIDIFEKNDFNHKIISPDADWRPLQYDPLH